MKYTIILNLAHDLPTQLNALGHTSVGLAHLTDAKSQSMRLFASSDHDRLAMMTDHPLIVLSAKSSTQLLRIAQGAIAHRLTWNAFTINMKFGTPQEQERDIAATALAELDLVALGLFGDAELLRSLTRRCSLYKISDSAC